MLRTGMHRRRWARHAGALIAALLVACTGSGDTDQVGSVSERQDAAVRGDEGSARSAAAEPAAPLIAVAGDIACDPEDEHYNGGLGQDGECKQKATSDLAVAGEFAAVLTVGDNQYREGELSDFQAVYDPTWGRVKGKTYPTLGNHEYYTPGAAGYYDYFGNRVRGPHGKGWYSFELGEWTLIALNTNCGKVRCDADSPQLAWLRSTLAASDSTCTLAYGHHPRFSSGKHGSNPSVGAIFKTLYRRGVELYLSGHDHDIERFRRLSPSGAYDAERGVRQFVIGNGGEELRPFSTIKANSQFRNAKNYGILRLRLRTAGFSWSFVGLKGQILDSGDGTCR